MMRLSSRGLAALLAAGVVLIGAALWITSRQPATQGGETGEPVLPGLEHALNAITKVRLTGENGKHTTLEKQAKEWIVGERGFPADSGLVRKLLIGLAQLKVVEDKTSDPANYAVIGVEKVTSPGATGTRIDLIEPGKTVSLIVGNPSGEDSSFVRRVHEKRSLLASPQIMPDADPKHWLFNTVIDLPQSRVQDVRVEPAGERPYTVSRASVKQLDFTIPDLPKGRRLSSVSAANSVADALSSLTLDDVHKPTGPQKYPAHAVFHTFDGLTVDVSGRQDGNSRYIELSAESSSKATQAQALTLNSRFGGWELEILGYQYDSIFQPLDGLLKPLASKAKKPAARRKRAKA
jgi:Domain of unknown function (DUF4340)